MPCTKSILSLMDNSNVMKIRKQVNLNIPFLSFDKVGSIDMGL